MDVPDHLRYSATHQWVRAEPDGTLTVGITAHAQSELGDVVYVESPQPGAAVTQGAVCGVVESVKTAADLHAPVSGVVSEVNAEIADRPERVNEDPYAAWLFRVKPAPDSGLDALLSAAAYRLLLGDAPGA